MFSASSAVTPVAVKNVVESKSGRGLPQSTKKAGHCCPAYCKNWRLLSHSELLPDGAVEPGISRINRQRARASDVSIRATRRGRRLECAFEGEGHLASSTTGRTEYGRRSGSSIEVPVGDQALGRRQSRRERATLQGGSVGKSQLFAEDRVVIDDGLGHFATIRAGTHVERIVIGSQRIRAVAVEEQLTVDVDVLL